MLKLNKIYNMDCIEGMKKLEDESIDLTVTSPPYDDLRDYKGYSFNFCAIADELYRITKNGGVVVWVVGDQVVDGSETGTSFKQALYFKEIGFRLHDTMIYKKHNFSNPSSTRYHQVFEYMFVLSKGKHKTFNPIKDRKNKYAGTTAWGKNTTRQKNGSLKERKKKVISDYGMRLNIWEYHCGYGFGQSDDLAYKHPATFPEKLAKDHIISWSNKGDLVLDPMCGSGTTCKMAKKNHRKYIGMDISGKYCKIARARLKKVQLKMF